MAELRQLPPYLLGHALEYAGNETVRDEKYPTILRSIGDFSFLLRLGVVSKAFLEALKYVEFCRVDVLDLLRRLWISDRLEYDGILMSHWYNARFQRWCEIASARLKHVTIMHDGGGWGCNYNAAQTRSIVDCAASFQNLTHLQFWCDSEPATLCVRLAEHLRAGRFTSLKRLEIMDKPCEDILNTAAVKLHMRDLMSLLPINMALDMHVGGEYLGLYPYLLEKDNEYETWRLELFELIDKGADVIDYPILIYMLADLHFIPCYGMNDWGYEHLNAAYSTIEALLARGVDPNRSVWGFEVHGGTALACIVSGLISNIMSGKPSPERVESLNRMLMRTMDLLLRHGAVDDPTPRLYRDRNWPERGERLDMAAWILARPDCTPLLRQDVLRRGGA